MGHDVDQLTSHSLALLRRRVAVIFQDFRLLNGRTALENVRLVLELRGYRFKDADRRAGEALDQVGSLGKEHQRIPELSGGEQQGLPLLEPWSANRRCSSVTNPRVTSTIN